MVDGNYVGSLLGCANLIELVNIEEKTHKQTIRFLFFITPMTSIFNEVSNRFVLHRHCLLVVLLPYELHQLVTAN